MKQLFTLLVGFIALTASAKDDRPNILFAFADDWGRYASIYAEADGSGTVNDLIKTPHIDRMANEGVLFKNAFVTAPSCTPCRSSLLSGQYFFRTGLGAILQGAVWDPKIPSWPLMLKDSGYHIGKLYKVWGPGTPSDAPYGVRKYAFEMPGGTNFNTFSQSMSRMIESGKTIDEAKAEILGKVGREFEGFLKAQPEDEPFCFWFGPTNVHRKWTQGSGKELWKLNPDELKGKMPKFLPDVPIIREDFADYLGEAMAFDAALGVLLEKLEATGQLENTLVVVSGDHGAPGFPRGKCNLYDFGTAVPLIARWGSKNAQIPAGRVVDDFVNLMDLAPTFLEAGGVEIPDVMTGRSILPVLKSEKSGVIDKSRNWVVTGRERHVATARIGSLPYPQRALRTEDYLYIVNFKPDRWPMGTPGSVADGNLPSTEVLSNETFAAFSDLDASPTKAWMIENRNHTDFKKHYELGFGKRPGRELYILANDPDQMMNVAEDPQYADLIANELHPQLMNELKSAKDPRVIFDDVPFEKPPYTLPNPPKKKPNPKGKSKAAK